MKTVLVIAIVIFGLASARTAVSDGPFLCLQSQRDVKACTKISDPVFGRFYNGTYKRFGSECEACKDWSVQTFYDLTDRATAKINAANTKCIPNGVPVCGVDAKGNMQDYQDECVAWSSKLVTSYFRGQCPREADPNRRWCPAIPRPVYCCFMPGTPICGTFVNGVTKSVRDGCGACNDPNLISYVDGACPGDPVTPIPKPLPVPSTKPVFTAAPAPSDSAASTNVATALKKNLIRKNA